MTESAFQTASKAARTQRSVLLARSCPRHSRRAAGVSPPVLSASCQESLAGKLYSAKFPENLHLDLAGIRQRLFDRLREVAAHLGRFAIVDLPGIDDHADFAPRLDGVRLLDAGKAAGQRFEFLEPFDVLF